MARKINLKSFRLGVTQLWLFYIQQYGKTFNKFFFFKYWKSYNLIFKILNKHLIFVNQIEFWHTNSKIQIKLYTLKNLLNTKNFAKLQRIIHILSYWFYLKKNSKITVYSKISLSWSSVLFSLYINYLFKTLNYQPKKILAILTFLVKKKLHKTKIIFNKQGPQKIKLTGYKIILKGRFENSKNPMAKTISTQGGSLTSTTLNNNIDLLNKNLYTKLGKCNLKIWLFYIKKNTKD